MTDHRSRTGPLGERHPWRAGFTVVEVLFAIIIMSMFMGMVWIAISYSGRTQKVAVQLDAYHEARMLNFRIASELKFSNAVLFPPPGEEGKAPPEAHQILFRDELNRIKVIFLNRQKKLMIMDYDALRQNKLISGKLLGEGVEKFSARQDAKNVTEYRAILTINKKPHEIMNQIKPANQL